MTLLSNSMQGNEPECTEAAGHQWESPHVVLGGAEDNPGVQHHPDRVIVVEVCRHCGRYRINETRVQSNGEEPQDTFSYRPADDASRAWVRARRA